MKKKVGELMLMTVACLLVFTGAQAVVASAGVMRFLKPTYDERKPAIVLVAFGTSTKAQVTFDQIDKAVKEAYAGHEVRWAFTSKIIRDKMNKRFLARGDPRRLHSLPEVLAGLEAEGWRKVVVQSLHIFPGQEYIHMQERSRIPGLKVAIGEPLLSSWEDVNRVLGALEKEFPARGEGCAVLAGHGSPNTYAAPSTAVYLALDRLLSVHFPNVFLGSVEGVPDRKDALERAKKCPSSSVTMVPFMLVAGDHVMNDIMGREADEDGVPSWAMELEAAGKKVSCPTVTLEHKEYFKGLGFYPEVQKIIIEHIEQALRDFI